MNWLLIYEIVYGIIVLLVCLRIIYDTRTITKTLAYLILAVFVPIFGIIFYFSFGINYRKRKIYSKKLLRDDDLRMRFQQDVLSGSPTRFQTNNHIVRENRELAVLLIRDSRSPVTTNNEVKVLMNGEGKFPEVLRALREAKDHIHIEYYIYEDDEVGREIEGILVEKVKEGVDVRFIYDDFGSSSIRRELVPRLRSAGVKAFPFYEIVFLQLANRLNYRNHRKIIVVDGITAFVGGINISDRYINKSSASSSLFWRDTHLRIDGPAVHYLQYLFLCDWNFCASDHLIPDQRFFPLQRSMACLGNKAVQIAASGPDSETPTILFSMLQAIHLAGKEILITTPYFIPGDSLMDALMVSALGGISVKLLVPGVSDSRIVDAASRSYFADLLHAGVQIYIYTKGFIHAKTMVVDRQIGVVGTANMDNRSFDLNFEVNAIIYDEMIAGELADAFLEDIRFAKEIDMESWRRRPWYRELSEKTARLISPLL